MKLNKKITIAACVATMVSTAAYAGLRGYFTETIYYSDATYTKAVGESVRTCMGNFYLEGQVTQYQQVLINEPCW